MGIIKEISRITNDVVTHIKKTTFQPVRKVCLWCAGDGWDSPFGASNGRKCRRCQGAGRATN